jgi:uncharacterized repeat protein (TIGR01451 family)
MRPNRRRSAALALLACGLALAVLAPCASARPATGGVGRFGGAIDWVEWGTNNQVLDVSAPITRTSTTSFSGHQLVVSCTISNFARVGGGAVTLRAYRSGNWSGDALDDLYNIGGVQGNNTLINGLSVSGMDVSFDFACSATLDGSPYALAGLVFADGEQSGLTEYVAGTISTSATWRLIDRFRTTGCANDAQVTRTVAGASQTLRLDNPANTPCGAGPAGVAFADGATSGRIAVRGGGTSAVALGAVVTFDHGDAPASYGDALHAAPYTFSGGVPPTGSSALFAGNTLADTTQPALRLGPSLDPEGTVFSATANGDDINPTGAFGPGDDETEAPPATINVDRGVPFTHTVTCSGSGTLAGWVDWNANGTFDAGERAGNATCSGGTASLTWTVPSDGVAQTRSFMRLRYAATAAEVADPSGVALSGEVEDHAFAITMPPDLTVTKTSSPATVEPGGRVTWVITMRNIGGGPSQGAIVQDTIPAGVTSVSAPGCTIVGATISCVFGPLNPGQSVPITLSGTAPSTTSTCFTNTATITTTLPAENNTSNNSAQATSCTRPPLGDVRIAKSASPTTVLQGNQVKYTLTVINAGPDPAENVQVADTAAAGVSPVSATPSQGSCATTSSCSLGTLGAGGTATIEIVATATALGTQGNTATVSTTTTDTDPSNNTASATIVVQPQADLRITKTASQTTLTEGDDFTYTLAVRNAGPATAVDTTVTDSIPAGISVRSVDTTRGSCSQADPIVCQLGDLAKDATATITIHATADRAGAPVNTAIVSSPTPDPDTSNNQDSTSLTTNARANLSITKTASAQTLLLGESFTYTLRVRNDGPSAAVNAVVTDRIPDGLQLEVASSSKGSCSGAPLVVCQLGTLAKGDAATISLTVSTHKSGTIDNSASVTSETPDADPDDNVDQARVEVGTRADLAITKNVSVKTVTAGDTVVYGVVVTNKGPHDAAQVTVTDPVPAGMRVVSANPSTGSCKVTAGTVVTCALGDLANGASVTIRIAMLADQAGSTRNVAAVTSPTPDPDLTNNQAETEITAEKADLSITKTGPTKPVGLGASITYTLTVRNAGPSGARGVVVTDPIPDGLRVTKATATRGSCAVVEKTVVCQLGDLAAGQTATVTVSAHAVRQGRVNNVASVTSSFPSDPNLRNNTDGAGIDVKPGAAKLSLAKRASRSRASVGSRVRYRIVVGNQGTRTAHDVRVCDDLPAGLSYVSHPGAKLRSGQACWTIPALAPHTTRTFTVTAQVMAGQTQRLVNLARLDGANVKPARDTAGIQRVLGERRAGGVTG